MSFVAVAACSVVFHFLYNIVVFCVGFRNTFSGIICLHIFIVRQRTTALCLMKKQLLMESPSLWVHFLTGIFGDR